jgi:regulatory protein
MRPRLSLKARALQLLAQREHSRIELRRKLLAYANQQPAGTTKPDAAVEPGSPAMFARRLPPTPEMQADVDALLEWLAENRHLSETRFLEARVRTRAARLGNLRIRQELAQHGLQLAPDEARALRDSELARARQVWARKFDGPAGDAAGRARQLRFLAGRGFSADVIRRLLRGDDDD